MIDVVFNMIVEIQICVLRCAFWALFYFCRCAGALYFLNKDLVDISLRPLFLTSLNYQALSFSNSVYLRDLKFSNEERATSAKKLKELWMSQFALCSISNCIWCLVELFARISSREIQKTIKNSWSIVSLRASLELYM